MLDEHLDWQVIDTRLSWLIDSQVLTDSYFSMYSLTLHVCLQQLVNSRLTVNRGADWQQQQNTLIADTITGNPVIYIVGYKKNI